MFKNVVLTVSFFKFLVTSITGGHKTDANYTHTCYTCECTLQTQSRSSISIDDPSIVRSIVVDHKRKLQPNKNNTLQK